MINERAPIRALPPVPGDIILFDIPPTGRGDDDILINPFRWRRPLLDEEVSVVQKVGSVNGSTADSKPARAGSNPVPSAILFGGGAPIKPEFDPFLGRDDSPDPNEKTRFEAVQIKPPIGIAGKEPVPVGWPKIGADGRVMIDIIMLDGVTVAGGYNDPLPPFHDVTIGI